MIGRRRSHQSSGVDLTIVFQVRQTRRRRRGATSGLMRPGESVDDEVRSSSGWQRKNTLQRTSSGNPRVGPVKAMLAIDNYTFASGRI